GVSASVSDYPIILVNIETMRTSSASASASSGGLMPRAVIASRTAAHSSAEPRAVTRNFPLIAIESACSLGDVEVDRQRSPAQLTRHLAVEELGHRVGLRKQRHSAAIY